MHETFKFEVIVHFDGDDGYGESINFLKREISRAISRGVDDVQDVEIDLIERTAE